jgi:DnaJ like chaperone protein
MPAETGGLLDGKPAQKLCPAPVHSGRRRVLSIWGRIREGVTELSWGSLFGLDDSPEPKSAAEGDARPAGAKQVGFTIAVIALGAKMAKADGVVTDAEIHAFHQIFRAPPDEQANVDFFFGLARRSTTGAETYARQAAKLLDHDKGVLEDLLGALFHIARADGGFAPAEDAYLRRIAQIFGFDEAEYRRIRAFHLGAETGTGIEDDPYLILGLDAAATPDQIKERWRQLVRENHPDRAMAQGLPAEFISIANAKLARINAAYAMLKQSRGAA